jgi:tetratricopeptide (TPR) repeat protein
MKNRALMPSPRDRYLWLALTACVLVIVCVWRVPRDNVALAGDDPSPGDLMKSGHWKRARALVEPEYKNRPDDAELNFLMSEIDDAFGNLDDARTLAQKAVALKGGEARYHRQLADVDGETAEAASLFAKAGWARKFKAEAERAAQLDPMNLDARFDLLEYDLQAPGMMGGGKDKAAAMADEIAKIDPPQGDLAQARIAQEAKNATAEESWYLKALSAKPGDYDVLALLAGFCERPPQPKFGQAERYAREAVKAQPGRVEGYALLASAYAAEARWAELDATLNESAKNVPDDLDPYYRAGLAILESSGSTGASPSRAEGYFRRYLGAEPEGGEPTLAHAHWRLGLVLEKEGRKPEAISELKTAVQLKPDLNAAKKDLSRLQ